MTIHKIVNKMKQRRNTYALIATAILLSVGFATAQEQNRNPLQVRLDSLEGQLQQAQLHKKQLSVQADSLAEIIAGLKAQRSRNLVSERELERQLRISQALAERQQDARQRETQLLKTMRQFSEDAVKILNDAIKKLTGALEQAKSNNDEAEKNRLAAALQQATTLRNRCQQYTNTLPVAIAVIEVKIQKDDSPKQIAQKADFILDQSDRLKNAAERIDKKLNALQDEVELRGRLADFVDDLAAFDPGNESVTGISRGAENAAAVANQETDFTGGEERSRPGQLGADFPTSQFILSLETNWPANTSRLSTEELQDWIAQLTSQQKTIISTADSLVQKAKAFRKILESKEELR